MRSPELRELPPQLAGLLTLVLVHAELAPTVRDAHVVLIPTGLGGYAGNKGGIGFRMTVHGFSLVLVNLHLPSGDGAEAREGRLLSFRAVLRHLSVALEAARLPSVADSSAAFCFGDLNFRLDKAGAKEARWRLRSRDWLSLLWRDELLPQLCGGDAASPFASWDEGDIGFRPTYKYDVGTSELDTSAKQRAPAWCDRVLWSTALPAAMAHAPPALRRAVHVLFYASCQSVVTSDHKPIKFCALLHDPTQRLAGQPRRGTIDTGLALSFPSHEG